MEDRACTLSTLFILFTVFTLFTLFILILFTMPSIAHTVYTVYTYQSALPDAYVLYIVVTLFVLFKFKLPYNKGSANAASSVPKTSKFRSGHRVPGDIQNIPYLYKKLSKSRFSDPFFGDFWSFLGSGAEFTL